MSVRPARRHWLQRVKAVAEISYWIGEENGHYFPPAVDIYNLTQVPQKTCAVIPIINPTSVHVVSNQDTKSGNEDTPASYVALAASRWKMMVPGPLLLATLPRRTCTVKQIKDKKKGDNYVGSYGDIQV